MGLLSKLKRFKKIKKTLLTVFLSSNLILLSTGSAELNLASDSAELESATQSAEVTDQGTPSPQTNQTEAVEGEITTEMKIDPTGRFVEDELIVKFKEGFSENGQEGIIKALNASLLRRDSRLKASLLKVDPSLRGKIEEALRNNPNVLYVEPNYVLRKQDGFGGGGGLPPHPNDYYYLYGYQWGLNMIQAPAAWIRSKGSSSVAIAILDTGVDYNHYDLGLSPSGRVVKGFDHWNQDSDPMDDNGHGTAVAGVAGAKTNNVSGIAAVDWYAKIVAIKIASSGGLSNSFIMAQGVSDAVELSISYSKVIINISFGGENDSQILKDAINNAVRNNNVYVVASVSNSATKNCFMGFPAAYSGVISVAATDIFENFASGCTGNVKDGTTYQKLQLVAPGKDILTLWRNNSLGFQPPPGSSESGATSLAASFVSGASSILATCSNSIRLDLIQWAIDLGPSGWDSTYGYGRVDIARSLSMGCN